ncbi:JOKA2-like protein, partial [Drosera capensis]
MSSMAASSVVFKVKYGDTLRRFNVQVDEVQPITLDVDGLRAKVRSLFNFPPDAAFTMTYVDEDNDIVTIGDEEDLRDVVKQGLDPVRIDVQLNDHKGGSFTGISSGSSTPCTFTEVKGVQSNIDNVVAEILRSFQVGQAPFKSVVAEATKSIPEPLLETLSKMSLDSAAKAVADSPALVELLDSLLKAGKTCFKASPSAESSTPNIVVEKAPQNPASPNAESNCDNTEGLGEGRSLTVNSENIKRKLSSVVSQQKGKDISSSVISGAAASGKPPTDDNTANITLQPVAFNCSYDKEGSKVDESSSCPFVAASLQQNSTTGVPLVTPSTFLPSHPFHHPRGAIFHRGVRCDACGMFPITGPRFKSKVKEDFDLCGECFFGLSEKEQDYLRIDFPAYRNPWASQFYNPMIPSAWGNPLHAPPPPPPFAKCSAMKKAMKKARSEEKQWKKQDWIQAYGIVKEQQLKNAEAKQAHSEEKKMKKPEAKEPPRLRLDSRFIVDVNVLDGTIMAPKTPFTKIWLLRNNGQDAWPRGTQLLWIGGDKFSDVDAVEIKVPLGGLPVESELEVAVDCTAPDLPGRYISYWRMSSPSGQKFGQRIWVLIQVDASLADLDYDDGLNLNLPSVSTDDNAPVIATKVEPVVDVRNQVSLAEALVDVSHPVETTEPLLDVSDPVAKTEPIVDVSGPVAGTEPRVDVYPIDDFLVDLWRPVARSDPIPSFTSYSPFSSLLPGESSKPLLAKQPENMVQNLNPPRLRMYIPPPFSPAPASSYSPIPYPLLPARKNWNDSSAVRPTVSFPLVNTIPIAHPPVADPMVPST